MKLVVKDTLSKIVDTKILNEDQALILLKRKLTSLGGDKFTSLGDDIGVYVELLCVYDNNICDLVTDEFKNALSCASESPKRIGKILRPNDVKMDKRLLEPVAKAVSGFYKDCSYSFNNDGFSIVQNNTMICSTKNWMKLDSEIEEHCATVYFPKINTKERLEEIDEKFLVGKEFKFVPSMKNTLEIKYLSITELMELMVNTKINK